MKTKARKSVPVHGETTRVAEAARHPHTPERRALAALVDLPAGELSEGAALAALIEAGRAAVAEAALAQGYEVLVAEDSEEDRAARAAMRGRTARRGR
jgi:hypothetical protein